MTDCVNVLINIPVDVALGILTRWLPAKVLPYLESAFCCKSGREKLHELFRSPGFVICDTSFNSLLRRGHIQQKRTVKRWEHARRLKFAHVHLIGDRIIQKLVKIGNQLGSHVESIHVQSIRGDGKNENVLLCISKQCPRLQLFHSNRSLLNSQLIQVFRNCKYLQQIRLESSTNSATFRPSWLNNITLPHLHALSVVGCQLSGQFVVALVRLSVNLLHFKLVEIFHFAGTYAYPLNHEEMLCIAKHVPNLLTLCLHTRDLFDVTLIAFLTLCPQIRNLNIDDCPKLTSASIYGIGQHLTQLQFLTLDGYEYDSEAIISIAERCQHTLHTLTYRNGSGYATSGVNTILQACHHIHTLTLQVAYLYQDGNYLHHVDIDWNHMHSLTQLHIESYDHDFKDPKLTTLYTNIATNCLRLQYLRLDFTIVKIFHLTVIVEYCLHLRTLVFRMNDFFDSGAVENWKSMRPSLTLLDIGDVEDADIFGCLQ